MSEKEYIECLRKVQVLMEKGDPKENEQLNNLVLKIEEYEYKHYPNLR